MDNYHDNYSNFQNEQNHENDEDMFQINDEKRSKIMFNEIIDDLIRKKNSKENELKNQIEKNKKNLLEKFYSLSNTSDIINNSINMNNDKVKINININNNKEDDNINKNNIVNNYINNNQLNVKEKENNNNNNNNIVYKNINIPNNMNPNFIPDGQKEYDEIREKYKNERNKKKSSIFKSEDLRISNTNSVHLKKDDFSPINPNMVNQETKNNILIIQKKLFGDSEVNEETSKVENIDEIDDLVFDDINNINNINIKDFKNEDNSINNNNNLGKTSNSNINITNLDTNNINFDLSSNLKSEINENENNYFFSNDILVEEKAVEYFYYGNNNKKDINKYDKFKDYKRQNNRAKNFSVQLVSKLDYYIDEEEKLNHRNKKRNVGSNQEVMNEMNNFIKKLIPSNLNNNMGNKFNGSEFNYEFDNIKNNININNINNNININNTNLAEIISQQELKQKKDDKNNSKKKLSENYINKNNTVTTKNNVFNKNGKNNVNNLINKIQKQIQKENKTKIVKNFKKIATTQKPFMNNIDLYENVQKVKTKMRLNFRHISNSNISKINKNSTNINNNNKTIYNNDKRKRKNNSVIIKREISQEKNEKSKEIFLINNNKYKEQKNNFCHFNTNNNYDNLNSNSNSNELNALKNNIKNIINQIPSFGKNPMTTKNKKVSISKIIKKKNKLNDSNGNNSVNNGMNISNSNNSTKNNKKSNNNVNLPSGNKLAILNTIHKNNLLKYAKLTQQIEAINKLKQHTHLGLYFIYAEKINEGFLFKGIYKKGISEVNPICNKIYGVQNIPSILSLEKLFIFTENNKKDFIPIKLSSLNTNNFSKSIILIRSN